MDLLTKKVLESKAKRLGKDLGFSDGFGGASSTQHREHSRTLDLGPSDRDEFPVQAATYFDNMPNNFPPILNLFYYDSNILSDEVRGTVGWAYRVLMAMEVLLFFNLVSTVARIVRMKGQGWIFIVLSTLVGIIVTVFELFAYDTAFRGAYRTNTRLRLRYIYLSTVTLILCGIYAFTGSAWFNGWTRIAQFNGNRRKTSAKSSEAASLGIVEVIFCAIESLGWTAALFLVTFTLFDFYHLWRSNSQGLSDQSLRLAQSDDRRDTDSNNINDSVRMEGNDRHRTTPNADRIEQIRNKYASRS